jgi:hypothetical protein
MTLRRLAKRATIGFVALAVGVIGVGAMYWKPLLIEWHRRELRHCAELEHKRWEAQRAADYAEHIRTGQNSFQHWGMGAKLDKPSLFLTTTHRLFGFPGDKYFSAKFVPERELYHLVELEHLGVKVPDNYHDWP